MKRKSRPQSRELKLFLLANLADRGGDIVAMTAAKFGISRQAVHRHLANLVKDGWLEASGATRARRYRERDLVAEHFSEPLANLEEHVVYEEKVLPALKPLSKFVGSNAEKVASFAFTEMLNNAIDHSEGHLAVVRVRATLTRISLTINDNGVGVFSKLRGRFGFEDEKQAALELFKGKLTTDHTRHTGEGIFFTSRMCDTFCLASNGLSVISLGGGDTWVLDDRYSPDLSSLGTYVKMEISTFSDRTPNDVFDKWSSPDANAFTKTHVPVVLSKGGDGNYISRSQAKRVLARVEKFEEVCLDFGNVNSIGQAFADEIFRVFALAHPEIKIIPIRASRPVDRMIKRALAAKKEHEASAR